MFGPGIGESVLVHLGNNEWLLVDSCADTDGPVALSYLEQIGVDPSLAIKSIVATHWHDDHINGLAWAFEKCGAARFICSDALNTKEFLVLTQRSDPTIRNSSGLDEFGRIIETIRLRKKYSRSAGPEFASENKRLFLRQSSPSIPKAEVWALSPSSGTRNLAIKEFAQSAFQEKEAKRCLVSLRPNQTAVALWINFGALSVLLGSDLENSPDPQTGWTAVLNSKSRPQGKAAIFKIPHHGSSNGDDPQVWHNMVSDNPIALLTPFLKSGLPRNSDVRRICKNTKETYITSTRGFGKMKKRSKTVEKTIKENIKTKY